MVQLQRPSSHLPRERRNGTKHRHRASPLKKVGSTKIVLIIIINRSHR